MTVLSNGIKTVQQLADLTEDKIKELEKEKGLKQITKYKHQAEACDNQPSSNNVAIDHRAATNPY